MKKRFAIVIASIFLSLICAVRCFGISVLMTDLDQSNIGSYNFGSIISLAVPFRTGGSPISVQSINLLMQQYQQVADEPFVEIYTATGSQPGTPVANAVFTPQLPLTSNMGNNVFNDTTPVILAADMTYDVVVSAHTLDGYWAWGLMQGTGETGPGGQIVPGTSEFINGGWQAVPNGTFGFNLVGTVVPEPSSRLIFAFGVLALASCAVSARKTTPDLIPTVLPFRAWLLLIF
jgi:hypothetical protein